MAAAPTTWVRSRPAKAATNDERPVAASHIATPTARAAAAKPNAGAIPAVVAAVLRIVAPVEVDFVPVRTTSAAASVPFAKVTAPDWIISLAFQKPLIALRPFITFALAAMSVSKMSDLPLHKFPINPRPFITFIFAAIAVSRTIALFLIKPLTLSSPIPTFFLTFVAISIVASILSVTTPSFLTVIRASLAAA